MYLVIVVAVPVPAFDVVIVGIIASILSMTKDDNPNRDAHPKVVNCNAPYGPLASSANPYSSNKPKLAGPINVMARGYAEETLPPPSPPKPSREEVKSVMVAGRARLYAR